ncbi:biotin/lipoyl-binding protein [Dermacoccus sp. 147Ba]|uniref:ATP-binding protein n=1 Tax=Dermacoccus sp. 147Ba TaxID=2510111 RepID=UPI00101DA071|nr:biotin carboxylase N-terminal domain-containing protein [Dermacoccus sp. 147Ba]RYI22420.1 biotin/lipoyl-binding protein [Dermacoccus sp. 147Ba]
MTTITSVLVANRGEIARRVFATCRARGIDTVAVYSDADANAPHVREADAAVRLAGVTPAETYLRSDLIVDAARRAGADAVHPGYGFLSENADFARAVMDAGLTWIGPPPEAIDMMASKVASKAIMEDAGVPVLERLPVEEITADHLPVLVKASAGGGGRGIRVVRALEELEDAFARASREAESAFGDGTVFCERYVESGHHIEVQVMADARDTVWAIGERECSVQRRLQKVIEEAPAPLVERVGGDMRERLATAARDAARAAGYRGAGTVEFLADDRGNFWFLEMNTRLQVEHPVTECVTGLDLVGLQIDCAEGVALEGDEPVMRGYSVEARLYAEDPLTDWAPASGTLELLEVPFVETTFTPPASGGIRLDAGVESGSEIGIHYDPMIAKVISFADERATAVRRLAQALRRAKVHGLTTNRDLLVATLLSPDFLEGDFDTRFYTMHPPQDLVPDAGLNAGLAACVSALADRSVDAWRDGPTGGFPAGFRSLAGEYQNRTYALGDESFEVRYRERRGRVEFAELPGGIESLEVFSASGGEVRLQIDGVVRTFRVDRYRDGATVVVDGGALGTRTLAAQPRFVDAASRLAEGALTAVMPGVVTNVAVEVGQSVTAGQPLVWLEAMKMEQSVTASADGVVSALHVKVGDQVEPGTVLAVVDAAEAEGEQA